MSMKQHLKVILTREKTTNVGLSTISAEQCCSGRFNNHRRDRPASFFALTENHTLVLYGNTVQIIFSIFLYNSNVLVIYQSKIPNKQGLLSSLLHIPNERRKLRFLEHFFCSHLPLAWHQYSPSSCLPTNEISSLPSS